MGNFFSAGAGDEILRLADTAAFQFAGVGALGSMVADQEALQRHIDAILANPLVDRKAIAARKFSLVVDAVNSSGGIAVPALLEALGIETVHRLYCEPDGNFAHNPEPLAENLSDLCREVVRQKADLGIAVDPDVDRLVLVCEDGELFGEEVYPGCGCRLCAFAEKGQYGIQHVINTRPSGCYRKGRRQVFCIRGGRSECCGNDERTACCNRWRR